MVSTGETIKVKLIQSQQTISTIIKLLFLMNCTTVVH
jgi:hypothetical protein